MWKVVILCRCIYITSLQLGSLLRKGEKKKADKGKEKAAKVSAIMATVNVVPELISYGRIISED